MLAERRRVRGFTIIELLVVIAIIGIVAAIGLQVGATVASGQRSRTSENIVRMLDQVLGEYVSVKGSIPPAFATGTVRDFVDPARSPAQPNNRLTFPVADGRFERRQFPILADLPTGMAAEEQRFDRDRDPPQPSTTLFFHQLRDVTSAEAAAKLIDSRFISRANVSAWGWNDGDNGATLSGTLNQYDVAAGNDAMFPPIYGVVIRDAFDQPIRYVHPFFGGGHGSYVNPANPSAAVLRERFLLTSNMSVTNQTGFGRTAELSRSFLPWGSTTPRAPNPTGDGDEGSSANKQPYFYSVGPDKNPGKRTDNLYTVKPGFPIETQEFSNK